MRSPLLTWIRNFLNLPSSEGDSLEVSLSSASTLSSQPQHRRREAASSFTSFSPLPRAHVFPATSSPLRLALDQAEYSETFDALLRRG